MVDPDIPTLVKYLVSGYLKRWAEWWRYNKPELDTVIAMGAIVLIVTVAITLLVIASGNLQDKKAKCLGAGNSWEVVGYTRIYQNVNNMLMPVQMPRYGCVED